MQHGNKKKPYPKKDTAFFKEIRDQKNEEVLSLLYE